MHMYIYQYHVYVVTNSFSCNHQGNPMYVYRLKYPATEGNSTYMHKGNEIKSLNTFPAYVYSSVWIFCTQ